MMNWFRKLEGDDYVLLVPIAGFLVVMGISFFMMITAPRATVAQDTAPAWEYAILVYGNDDAHVFTGNTETDNALTGLLVPQDSDASNIALALNVMGNDGWEMVDIIPAASSLYMFKRPKD
jgi:hypothetical protein